jgi:hypothetical protein
MSFGPGTIRPAFRLGVLPVRLARSPGDYEIVRSVGQCFEGDSMPYFTHRFPIKLGMALLLTAMTLAACGEKEPTAAEAGATLKTHILELLKEVDAQNIEVTDPGRKDIPCGEEKVKRSFAATGQDIAPERKASSLNEIMLSASKRVSKYKLVSIGNPDDINDPMIIGDAPSGTSLVLQSSSNGQYSVRGETACLNRL